MGPEFDKTTPLSLGGWLRAWTR